MTDKAMLERWRRAADQAIAEGDPITARIILDIITYHELYSTLREQLDEQVTQ